MNDRDPRQVARRQLARSHRPQALLFSFSGPMNAVQDQPPTVAAEDVERPLQAGPPQAVPVLWVLVGVGEYLSGAHLEPASVGGSPPRESKVPTKPREPYLSAGKVKGPQPVHVPGDVQEPTAQFVRHHVF